MCLPQMDCHTNNGQSDDKFIGGNPTQFVSDWVSLWTSVMELPNFKAWHLDPRASLQN